MSLSKHMDALVEKPHSTTG